MVPAADGCSYLGLGAAKLATACAESYAAKRWSLALGLAIDLAGGPERDLRLAVCLQIDDNARLRGYLTQSDGVTMARLAAQVFPEAAARLGYDPRFPRPIALVKVISAAPSKLPPLTPGDWEELNRRVQSGAMGKGEALEVKAQWDALAKATDDIIADLVKARA